MPAAPSETIACRFAWPNEAADLWRDLHQTRVPFAGRRSEAPHYVEIEDGDTSTTVLTGGLPFHARSGERMLDSLLVVRGESARKFSLGIGVELKHPLLEAMSLLAPVPQVIGSAAPPSPADSSWLFQIDVRRVIATHWEPVAADGSTCGVRVRLLETGGRAAHAKLMGFRPFTSARRLDFRGNVLGECKLNEGTVEIDLPRHQCRLERSFVAERKGRIAADRLETALEEIVSAPASLALAAYHMGPTAVSRARRKHPQLSSQQLVDRAAGSKTRAYVANVLGRFEGSG